jgi:acyl-[acyl-carrier-protein]-phospholipid O-acyltransferase / long-chain-fatty-acid--[acyl-carrier-protein] ligase
MKMSSLKFLLVAQFFGAFNDNAWKLAVAFLAIRALDSASLTAVEFQTLSQYQTTLAFSVLTVPLMLFSIPAGVLADRIPKNRIIVWMKGVEVALMLAAVWVLLQAPEQTSLLLLILGLMGAQSALFSPAKYGILPEILPHERLTHGNGLLEAWTFLAIILGTAFGGALLDWSGQAVWLVGAVLFAFSLVGFWFALGIRPVPAARGQARIVETIRSAWSALRGRRILGLAAAGSIAYWSIASMLGQNVLVYCKSVLGLSDTASGAPLAAFGLGVAAGSVAAGKISGSKVEYGLIPLGAILMALFTAAAGLLSPGFAMLLVLMALLGVASGFIIVPINALIQWRAPEDRRGAVIALTNVFVFSGIFAGSLAVALLASLGLTPQGVMLVGSLLLAIGTASAVRLLPDALLRLVLVLLTHSVYRLRVLGIERLPAQGGVLLAPNHISFIDGLMLMAALDRPIRFIVEKNYFDFPLLRPFLKSLKAIPITASQGPRVILKALRDAGRHLDAGEIVCIFPEGQITRTGTLLPFRRGLERIAAKRSAAIVPVYLDRLWGSLFGFDKGRFLFKLPRDWSRTVVVAFGEPLPAGAPAFEIRHAVQQLGSVAWAEREAETPALHVEFVRQVRRGPLRLAFSDLEGARVNRIRALAGAALLARRLLPWWRGAERVGILLPPSIGGALVNLAASLSGRAAVNLNYTLGESTLASTIRQAGLTSVATSRRFLERFPVPLPSDLEIVFLEDLAPQIGAVSRLGALLAAVLLPVRLLEKWCGAEGPIGPQSPATVIFSSGSTGDPKGVVLSHFNIAANSEAVAQVIRAESRDSVLGILPFFHSFGYMALWFAARRGLAMPLHPSPLDAPAVGGLVQRDRVTILLATPTFLQLYMRRCTPAQFGSLRLVVAGAEKLTERVALEFEDRFGVRPLEGYGATECSPVIAASVPDFRAPGYFQPGRRRGFVGQPLPGVSVKIIHPDTWEPLPPETPGMILVKGPNVMQGYLDRPDLTERVFRDGWYVTGDIGLLSEDGFLQITGRVSRFSKIGGEMVSHGAVEEALHQALGVTEPVFAVAGVADPRKGEALAVLHTCPQEAVPELLKKLSEMGLSNLYIPRKDRFIFVAELPLLGSGKLDLKRVSDIARRGQNACSSG